MDIHNFNRNVVSIDLSNLDFSLNVNVTFKDLSEENLQQTIYKFIANQTDFSIQSNFESKRQQVQ